MQHPEKGVAREEHDKKEHIMEIMSQILQTIITLTCTFAVIYMIWFK